MNFKSVAYRAEWIVPIDGPPIRNGVVRIANGLIQSVDKNSNSTVDEVHLGQTVLLPGLVNAHTHLEFSDLEAPLGHPGIEFTDWIELVVQHRIEKAQQAEPFECKSLSIAKGLKDSAAAGVALIGEISTHPACADAYDASDVDVVAFLERLGRDDSQLEIKLQSLDADFESFREHSINVGISPHAPYSVSDRLLDGLLEFAASKQLAIAMHLAESQEELELLKSKTGPFVNLLEKLQAWHPESYSRNTHPMTYAKCLATAKRALLIHGNFLTSGELDFVACQREQMTIVYCPRTHQYFGHPRYPLPQMLESGIEVAVGTDSRASNPDLSVLSELRTIHQLFPEIAAEQIVRMGTINGAKALGKADLFGSLTPGKMAALCAIQFDRSSEVLEPYEAIWNGSPSLLD